MLINLPEILSKISEINNSKITTLTSFISSKIWCYGDLVWDTHLPDLDTQLQAFSDQELIDLGSKLIEIKSKSTQALFAWLISKSTRLTNLITLTNLSSEVEANRNELKELIAQEITILHGICKFSEIESLLQEALTAVQAMTSIPETEELKQKLIDKIGSLP